MWAVSGTGTPPRGTLTRALAGVIVALLVMAGALVLAAEVPAGA